MPAETLNVFVDTQVFDQHHLDFSNSPAFKRLVRLALSGELQIVLTDVTAREIRRHLDEAARKAVKQASNFNRLHQVTKRLVTEEDLEGVKGITGDQFATDLLDEFEGFLKKTNAIVLPVDEVRVSEVLDRFYAQKAPFGTNGKKYEFPDAIAAMTLEKWCKAGHPPRRIYIISGDKDWRRVCDDTPEFIRVTRFEELLEKFADVEAAAFLSGIKRAVAADKKAILTLLQHQVDRENIHFYTVDSMIDGEVQDATVLESDVLDVNVIEAAGGEATVSAVCWAKVRMNVIGDDPDSQWRDDDDGSLHSVWRVSGTIEREIEMTATVGVEYDTEEPGKAEVLDIDFDYEDINIEVDEGEVSVDYDDEDRDEDDDPDPSWFPDDEGPTDEEAGGRRVEF